MKPMCTKRSRDYYRHQEARVSAKRKREIRRIYGSAEFERLKRGNALRGLGNRHFFGCSCDTCKWEKHRGIEKPKYAARRGDLLDDRPFGM